MVEGLGRILSHQVVVGVGTVKERRTRMSLDRGETPGT